MDNMSCVLASPVRGAFDFCSWSDVPVPLGLPFSAGSIFAGPPRKETLRTLHPVSTIVGRLVTKAQALAQYQIFSVNTGQKLHNE